MLIFISVNTNKYKAANANRNIFLLFRIKLNFTNLNEMERKQIKPEQLKQIKILKAIGNKNKQYKNLRGKKHIVNTQCHHLCPIKIKK